MNSKPEFGPKKVFLKELAGYHQSLIVRNEFWTVI